MTPPTTHSGEVGQLHVNRRRKPDPVRMLFLAAAVSGVLAAAGWAASSVASGMTKLREDFTAHEKDDAAKWGQMQEQVKEIASFVKEAREAAKKGAGRR